MSHVHEVGATLPHALVGEVQQTACRSGSGPPPGDQMPSQLPAEARLPSPLLEAAASPSQQQRVTPVPRIAATAAPKTAPASFVSNTVHTLTGGTRGEQEATITQICTPRKRPLETTRTGEQTDFRETLRRKEKRSLMHRWHLRSCLYSEMHWPRKSELSARQLTRRRQRVGECVSNFASCLWKKTSSVAVCRPRSECGQMPGRRHFSLEGEGEGVS